MTFLGFGADARTSFRRGLKGMVTGKERSASRVGMPALWAFLLLIGLITPSASWAQATSVADQYDVVVHVSQHHAAASDSNPGTQAAPLRTVSRAAEIAASNSDAGISTKVLIHPGAYRESVRMGWADQNHPRAAIRLEAAVAGTVKISGSDVWDGWQREGSSNIYTHPWPYNWGVTPDPWGGRVDPPGERREMIFVNGVLLRQVVSRREMETNVNTFYVTESANTAYIHLPAGTNIENTVIEVGVRPVPFRLSNAKNFVVKGLIIEHANSEIAQHAAHISGENILIEDVTVRWNNWNGLAIFSANTTIRRVVANHNGSDGLTGHRSQNLLVEDSETSHNNWRGAMGGMIAWAVGQKFLRSRGVTFRRHTSTYNQSPGLWFDWDNADVVVEDSFLCHNLLFGLFLEASQGPFSIRRNVICHNRVPEETNDPEGIGGLRVTTAENITLEGNVLYGNGRSQIATTGAATIREVDNWETGRDMAIRTRNFTLDNNVLVGKNADQFLVELEDWDHFFDTLVSDNNVWYNPEHAVRLATNNARYDLKGWQSFTGQDANSVFADPLFLDPENGNFDTQLGSPWKGAGASQSAQVGECVEVGVEAFHACYYDNPDFTDLRLRRVDPVIDFDWGEGSPHPSVNPDTFSVIWQGDFTFEGGEYEFTVQVDDGVRLYLDGVPILERWQPQGASTYKVTATVTLGVHTVKMEYFDDVLHAVSGLSWARVSAVSSRHSDLSASSNGRYLVKNGVPFFAAADTAWAIFLKLSKEDAELYLSNRAAKGFNVVQAGVNTWFGNIPNVNGDKAFNSNDVTQPNERYFEHVDWIIDKAAEKGIYMAVAPWFFAEESGNWLVNTSKAFNYGRWLGDRYKDRWNIIWIMGGDLPPDRHGTTPNMWAALARGITVGVAASEDFSKTMMTYHSWAGTSSSEYFHPAPWLDFNMIQIGRPTPGLIHPKINSDYNLNNPKPVAQGEGWYENLPGGCCGPPPDNYAERDAYWTFLAGGTYHAFGNHPIFEFGDDWKESLDSPGAEIMRVRTAFLTSREWWRYVPDQGVFAAGIGSGDTLNAAARTTNGDSVIVFLASQTTVSVRLNKISSSPMVAARWLNPYNGVETVIGTFPNSGNRSFTTPEGWETAVLVLDAAGGRPKSDRPVPPRSRSGATPP